MAIFDQNKIFWKKYEGKHYLLKFFYKQKGTVYLIFTKYVNP